MADLFLPSNSVINKKAGKTYSVECRKNCDIPIMIKIYRWGDIDRKNNPRLDTYKFFYNEDETVLDLLLYIRLQLDSTLAFRHSCRHGSCGSCAMNINGTNSLACTTRVKKTWNRRTARILILPLPHCDIIRDLVIDLTKFFEQISSVKPWLQNDSVEEKIIKQSQEERKKLDGLYECILCACCTTSCPSYWWSEDKGFLGAAALLQAYRWIQDTRDQNKKHRLNQLNDAMALYRCHLISNCTRACPKKLDPALSIRNIKIELSNLEEQGKNECDSKE